MKSHLQIFILALAVIGLPEAASFANVPTTTGIISNVTVYRGQALVTRTIDIDLGPGASELIIKNLPAGIIPLRSQP